MASLQEILNNQPYPCFELRAVPEIVQHQLKKGMLCLYNIEKHIFEFPVLGQVTPAEELLSYLGFIGYYSIPEFRDLVFTGRLPVSCPCCKGPVEDAGMISYELEESGTAQVDFAMGDAEIFVCELCNRPFALMPTT